MIYFYLKITNILWILYLIYETDRLNIYLINLIMNIIKIQINHINFEIYIGNSSEVSRLHISDLNDAFLIFLSSNNLSGYDG